MPETPREARDIDRAFRITITLKGLDGLLEVIGGMVLLFVSPHSINQLVKWATAHELAQDPNDFVSRHLLHSASQLSPSTTLYGALYLLIHGASKVVLVVFVLRNKLWAYPWMIGLLLVFIAYQLYRMTYKPSVSLALLTLFDAVVTWLTWREYGKKKALAAAAG